MGLYCLRVPGLTENLQELVIGQEVKPACAYGSRYTNESDHHDGKGYVPIGDRTEPRLVNGMGTPPLSPGKGHPLDLQIVF